MTHPQSERWSDFIDGELTAEECRDLTAHLAGCGECRELVDSLRRVVACAGALEDRPPPSDLWPRVSVRIGLGRRRLSFTVPQLMAASVALMLLSGGGVAFLLRGHTGPGPVMTEAGAAVPSGIRAASATAGYDVAIGRLQQELSRGGGSLDSTTMRVIEEKLALIDQAILDAERAVASDPASEYLQAHLTRARLGKLELLRRATELTRTIS